MSIRHSRFPRPVQKQALKRQKGVCASCEAKIADVGEGGQASHPFGERAEGHHLIPNKMGGPISVENCVVLCRACHMSAHQGGYWADVSIYHDIKDLPMNERIAKIAKVYPHYSG
jgi:5-methylcytosine-specific restriction endonuclease McrA